MLTKALSAAVLGLSLAAVPAFAQTSAPPANTAPQNTSGNQPTNQTHETASQMNLWPASKLKGLAVYNEQNEKIGDINELLLNKDGQVEMVGIGVGGFLGLGSHDVAVKYSELKWSNEPVRNNNTSSNAPAGGTARPAGTVGTAGTAGTTTTASNSAPKNYPDHAVLNMTKDQLKALPQFDYNK